MFDYFFLFFSFLLLDGNYICCIFDVYDFFVRLNFPHVTRDMLHFDGIPVGLMRAMLTDNGSWSIRR